MDRDLTFVFEDNQVFAIREGHVVEAADSIEELEDKLAGGHKDGCECGFCQNKGKLPGASDPDNVDDKSDDDDDADDGELKESSTHVVTPNGIEGKILGKVAGLWSDTVTVRLDNGRIIHVPVTNGMKFEARTAAAPAKKAVETFRERLAASVDGSAESLARRREELKELMREAQVRVTNADFTEAQELDSIYVEASVEATHVDDALRYLEDAEPFAAPAPFRMQAVEQETLGGGNSTWLDSTVNDMIAEAEATDYDQLLNEGPEAFVTPLPDAAIADAGSVRQMASSFIRSKTAGANEEVRDEYEQAFLARIEDVRRSELADRKEVQRKTAAAEVEAEDNATDEGLFL